MWHVPGYVWVNALAVVIMAGGIVAARGRRRRLAQFGDAVVLGTAKPWPRLLSVLLTAGAAACLALILTMPAEKRQAADGRGGLQLIIDRQLLDDPNLRPSDSVSDAVRAIVGQAPPRSISVALAGDPPETLIPPTSDAQGLLMLIDSALAGRTSRGPAPAAKTVVYLTAQQEVTDTGAGTAFVRPGPPLVFGIRAADGNLQWSEDPAGFREFLKSGSAAADEVEPTQHRVRLDQRLALLAFILLAAGFAWTCFR